MSCELHLFLFFFFFSSRRRHTRWTGDWSSDVCSSDLKSGHDAQGSDHRVDARNPNRADRDRNVAIGGFPAHGLLRRIDGDRKSTRLNSSHPSISYAVFCLKKKKKQRRSGRGRISTSSL